MCMKSFVKERRKKYEKNNKNFLQKTVIYRYAIQHCFICRPSSATVLEDAGIQTRTVATFALAVKRSNHSTGFHLVLAE
jgi:hypothetical protein